MFNYNQNCHKSEWNSLLTTVPLTTEQPSSSSSIDSLLHCLLPIHCGSYTDPYCTFMLRTSMLADTYITSCARRPTCSQICRSIYKETHSRSTRTKTQCGSYISYKLIKACVRQSRPLSVLYPLFLSRSSSLSPC